MGRYAQRAWWSSSLLVNEGGFGDEADVRLEGEGCIQDDTKVADLGHI